jgi:ABC-type multidrug transport system ATPase subunit
VDEADVLHDTGKEEEAVPPSNVGKPVVVARTPVPSDWEQTWTLLKRNFRNDRKKRPLLLARLFLGPLMWMLYTIAYLINSGEYQTEYQEVNGFRLYPGTTLPPASETIYLAGSNETQVETVEQELVSRGQQVITVKDSNITSFQEFCDSEVGTYSPNSKSCVFLDEEFKYTLFFGGGETILPFDSALAGTQSAVQDSILVANSFGTLVDTLYPVDSIQQVPERPQERQGASAFFTVFPGVMLALATSFTLQFMVAPLSTEKFKEVSRSFLLIGVKARVYLQQWFLYLASGGILTAGVLTGVSIVWNIFAESSVGLLFLSHFLAITQLASTAVFVSQVIWQEELAQGLPFLSAVLSMAVSVPIVAFVSPANIGLAVLTIFSPFIGIIQYCGIYGNYDALGFGTGIHAGENVQESGLLGNIVGQLVGILLSQSIILYLARTKRPKVDTRQQVSEREEMSGDHFEPLPPSADLLLTVRDIEYTYEPGCCSKAKPVEVLKGLDLNLCRGEVFSYLGINGSGKTTSLKVLAGELPLTHGSAKYHFRDGDASLDDIAHIERVRKHVGVCPQHNDSLHGEATCREMLKLFAQLKGNIPQNRGQSQDEAIDTEVQRRLDDIKFTSPEDADKPIESYSGGMKRKVCIALAFLGDPEVVFLDEPTAGVDPLNRRIIWDMIIASKQGRSIILCTHFMDEADTLGDRVGIIKEGKLATSGSTLFLKHHFGAGYSLNFESPRYVDISELVEGAESVHLEKEGSYRWSLQHGKEASFPNALRKLNQIGAANVALELTTLEEIFLQMSEEEPDAGSDDNSNASQPSPPEDIENQVVSLKRIWQNFGTVNNLSFLEKVFQVQKFLLSNAWRMKGAIFFNITMPILYVVIGLVVVALLEVEPEERVVPSSIPISPRLVGSNPSQFFGLSQLINGDPIAPLVPTDPPETLEAYFEDGALPIACGYFSGNNTLQYNQSLSPFALQVGLQVLANYTALQGGSGEGVGAQLQQLGYTTQIGFRWDLLLIPMFLAYGFAGMAFSVLDVLLLRADNIVGLFQVTGISEWATYLGVMLYKCATTFVPFFLLLVILGLALKSVLFGNAGRWLASILVMFLFAFSNTPMGCMIAKRFVKTNFRDVANWFPGVYMTFVALPYLALNIAYQTVPGAQNTLLIISDILCILPPFAFQRGLGSIIAISPEYSDADLSWGDVWSWESRVWYTLLAMFVIGGIEWIYLYRLTTSRPAKTRLNKDEQDDAKPIDESDKADVTEERERSLGDDTGINARDLVKLFRIKAQRSEKDKGEILKKAVKGVSFGVKKNEIYVMVGPNGSGKTTSMKVLAGEYTAEHGTVALENATLVPEDRGVDHLFSNGQVSYCQQFDSVFPNKTVQEHLHFYAKMRGLDWNEECTQQHVEAVVQLLGLQEHKNKLSTELSGGYKRRLCLGVAMIGFPKCMMVDECTTGMDPSARHLVWQVLKPEIRDGYDLPAILFSTHYMDEATSLGTRIGILIDGELVSTGSLASLQNRYCNAFFVEIALTEEAPDVGDAQDSVLNTFESKGMVAETYEALPYQFKLKVPFEGDDHLEQLASIFDLLETNHEALHIKYYSVAQMNLEQIFIDLSRKQTAAEEEIRSTRNLSSTRL